MEKKFVWWPPYRKCLKEFKLGKGNKFKEKCKESLEGETWGAGRK